jgi:hypothetical protein
MLELVLRLLPPRALKAAVLVCRRWRAVGEAPGLWAAWVRVTEDRLLLRPGVLGSRRLQAVESIELGWAVTEELLEAVATHPARKCLTLDVADFKYIELLPQVLVGAIQSMDEVRIRTNNSVVTRAAAGQMLDALGRNPRLTNLRIDIFFLSPDTMESLVTALEQLELEVAGRSVISTTAASWLDIRAVTSLGRDSSVTARVREVELRGGGLTGPQAEAIVAAISGGSFLIKLDMAGWTEQRSDFKRNDPSKAY